MNNTTFTQWIEASPFRKNVAVLILVFAALALITKTVLLYKQVNRFGLSDNYPQTISVSGKAEEFVKPDTLTFTITVNEEGKDVVSASKKADVKIAKAMEVLKANGVDEKNVKTIARDVTDVYGTKTQACTSPAVSNKMMTTMDMAVISQPMVPPCVNTTSSVTGTNVAQTLEVKIPDIDKDADGAKREKLIADLAAAGLKTGQITFTVFDIEPVKARVRAEAIKKARADAKILSKSLGVRLGQIQSFSDNAVYNPYISAREMDYMAKSATAGAPVPQLPAGEQKVTSDVSISYLIK